MTKVTLAPGEVHLIRGNQFRQYLAITCSGNWELDGLPLTPNAIVERISVLGENPQREYRVKNIESQPIECVILEEVV